MGRTGPELTNEVRVTLLPQSDQYLPLLLLSAARYLTAFATAPWFPAHAHTQHPLTSLNTHCCCVCDLSSNRCYRNAKLLVPALRMSAGRKLWCRQPWRFGKRCWISQLPSQEAAAPDCRVVPLLTLCHLPGIRLLGRMHALCWLRTLLLFCL